MVDLLGLYSNLLLRSFAESRWLHWLLGISFAAVVAGLVPVLWRGGDVLLPFGILGLDLAYVAALAMLFLFFAVTVVSLIGIPLLRYGGVWLMILGIGIFGYQVYGYAKFDEWQSFPLRDFTDVLFLTMGLDGATGWAKRILRAFVEETPLSLSLIACGVVWHVYARRILDHELQALKGAESQRLKPMDEARARPKLAVSPGRWIPTRLYRRTPPELRKPVHVAPMASKGESSRLQGTGVRRFTPH
jgi:hypothetical protein